jgi:DNA end-binding protein Ku
LRAATSTRKPRSRLMIVDEDEEVKGYECGEDYVMLEDEQLESVALESTRTIDIDVFVPKESIE